MQLRTDFEQIGPKKIWWNTQNSKLLGKSKKQGLRLTAWMYWKMQEYKTISMQFYSFHSTLEAATGTCTVQEFIAAIRVY